jgi:aminoglycoside phosphotransferase (APT) family kinase protein
MDEPENSLAGKLESYLPDALKLRYAKVSDLTQFLVGGSRSTFGFTVRGETQDGTGYRRELILRLDPPHEQGSLVPSNMAGEYDWYRAFHADGSVPVPEPIGCETDPAILGAPFMLMQRMSGYSDWKAIAEPRFSATRQQLCAEAFAVLGRIAAADVRHLGLDPGQVACAAPATAWSDQLDYWDAILLEHEFGPMPVTRAAVRKLRSSPPPAVSRPCVVHGDFRIGNFLYDTSGVVGILDWEMGHLGDPHEDMAWASLPNWRGREQSKIWGIVDDEEAIYRAWECTSGMTLDRESLAWWTLFSHVKGIALWLKGASAVARGHSDQIGYLSLHWALAPRQEQWMVAAMDALRG